MATLPSIFIPMTTNVMLNERVWCLHSSRPAKYRADINNPDKMLKALMKNTAE